jgi:hypothetical protein
MRLSGPLSNLVDGRHKTPIAFRCGQQKGMIALPSISVVMPTHRHFPCDPSLGWVVLCPEHLRRCTDSQTFGGKP